MKRTRLALLLVFGMLAALLPVGAVSAQTVTSDLVITGVIDGPLTGGIPKAIELYVVNDIADLSIYGLGAANNGGGTDGQELTFDAVPATAGDFIHIATDEVSFNTFFGFAPDYTTGTGATAAANINGDDAIELFMSGGVVDVFGDINTDGSGQPWEYLDGWAYRVDGTGPDGDTFTIGNWTFSGINALDNETSNGTADVPFPIASYSGVASGPTVLINEVDADTPGTDAAEFVELFDGGAGNTALDGLVVVFYNGSDDASYLSFDLDGLSTDADGYFVLGNPGVPNVDLTFDPGSFGALQNGADAVALHEADATDFPNDTPVTTANLLDAIVYDTSDPDDGGLLVLLNAGQPQVDENGRGNKDNHSNQRCPNGSGIGRNTTTYSQFLATPGEANVCEDPPAEVFIHEIQGDGDESPLVGQTVAIEGIVVGDFQEANQIGGFHVQEEDSHADDNPDTSEGIYVFAPNAMDVSIGDTVRVIGSVSEFFGLTELVNFDADAAEIIAPLDPASPASPVSLTLPFDSANDFERYEGMSVILPQALVIAEYFDYDRYGEIVLSSERRLQPTAQFDPNTTEAMEAMDLVLLDRIILDDGQPDQNPDFTRHPNGEAFSLANRFRGGDTLTDVGGVMEYSFGEWKIQPTGPATYNVANPRPATPDDVGGDVTVASFNVLNYYTTLDESGSECFPSFTRNDCRGADDAEEFARQRAKIILALAEIDADVVGLIEIENNVDDDAVIDLVAGLNDVVGADTYDYVPAGITGTDTIKVAFIYKPAVVSLKGPHAVLDSADFLDPADTGVDRNRAALAQTFTENATGASFTAVVNHFKSKSGSEIGNTRSPDTSICLDSDPLNDIDDCDQGDGQAYFNYTRTLAAQVLTDWLAGDPTGSNDSDVLVLGDLNAYDHEDPIYAMKDGGYTDLVGAFQGEYAYSYVFDGQIGYLDYGMANSSLRPQVTGTTVWHLNADEPDILDYDTSFKSDNQDDIFDIMSPFRSSDHDPVIVGLALAPAKALKETAGGELSLLLPTGNKNDDKSIQKAIDRIEQSLNPDWWVDDSTLDPKDGGKVFDREHQAVQELMKVKTVNVQAAVDAIITADRQLALKELLAAIDAGGNASRIQKAWDRMADAAENVADGEYAKAILDYKKAWQEAIKA